MKRNRYLIAGLAGVLALTTQIPLAAAQEITREETLIIDHAQSPQNAFENWNYLLPGAVLRAVGLHQFVMEPLFVLNLESGEIEPWIGESMTANDTLDRWTLKIREGVTWQDGEAFDADDVIFTIETMLANAPALRDSASLALAVDRVERVDDLTVEFVLTAPNPRFQLDMFSVRVWGAVMFVPEHIYRDEDPLTFTNYDIENGLPLGTGPYKLVSASPTEFIYDRVDDWWASEIGFKELPAPRRIIYMLVGTEQARGDLAVRNDIDVAWNMSLGTFEVVQARNPNWITWRNDPIGPWLDPCHRGFDLNFTVAPWDDIEMRKALDLGIDRDEVNVFAFDDIGTVSKTVFPAYPTFTDLIAELEEAGFASSSTADVETAKQIIESKGYVLNDADIYEKDGEPLALTIEARDQTQDDIRMAEVLIEQLRRIGIDAQLQRVNDSTLQSHHFTGDYEAIIRSSSCGSVNEPWHTLNQFTDAEGAPIGETAGTNLPRWSGPDFERYTALVNELGTLPLDDPRVRELTLEAYELFHTNHVSYQVVQAIFLLGFNQTYWTNWPTAENNYMQPAYWWHGWVRALTELEPAS
ncbi:MAG TPA: ABC transporter substrate-binding protein [Devosiaceae bacterium]|jgi:peptide/nickel transport system substrate-binding protein|nr:ABC transporter substrate-binding protein [Devosiaceae bacterium]